MKGYCFIFLLIALLFSSCGMYKYTFQKDDYQIVSAKGNPITQIRVSDEKGKLIVWFDATESGGTRFSLLDFSPHPLRRLCLRGTSPERLCLAFRLSGNTVVR